MCGIAGIVGKNRDDILVRTMTERIAHRGPDGLHYWEKNEFAFGHARLSIIDLSSAADQPMIDPSSGNVVIFNGEIFNYLELKEQLKGEYNFVTQSDTEVLLALYRNFGINMLLRIRGMFAFALYDDHLKKVFIARDRMGIKPLYYRNINGTFYFGSEIRTLTSFKGIQDSMNEFKVYEFLADARLDADESTMFNDVMHLPPASYMWIDQNGKSNHPQTYWDFPELGKRKFTKDESDELFEITNETIKIHMRSDVPVGTFLSGGLDSSTVTCFALNNMNKDSLHVFSAILPYFHPENSLIKEITHNDKRIICNDLLLTGEQFFDDIPKVILQNESPILDGSMYTHYKLCELAKQNNVKVLLSGSGGDELFGGYESMVHAQHARLLHQGRFLKYLKDLLKFRKARINNTYSNLFLRSVYETIPTSFRRIAKNLQLRIKYDHINIHPTVKHYYHSHSDPFVTSLLNNYRSWTAPPFLHYEDRNSMNFGIEVRVPFFDHKLIEFIFQFNSHEIISGSSKSIMRNSYKNIVPEKILQQKGKYGFPSPLDHILKNNKQGKEIFFDRLDKTPLLIPEKTRKMANEFYDGKGDLSSFWRTLSYMIWYQLHFEK